jgi:hypothetical protein
MSSQAGLKRPPCSGRKRRRSRLHFHKQLVKKPGGFTHLIESCRNDMRRLTTETIKLAIRRSRTVFQTNDIVIRIPREHLLLLFLAEHASEGKSRWAQYIDVEDELNSYRQRMIRTTPEMARTVSTVSTE